MIQRTVEEYIECIHKLGGADRMIRTTNIAESLNVSAASVTEMLQKLESENYISYERYKGALLTKKGLRIAEELKHRHIALRNFLMALGLDEETSEKDACTIEHVVTPDTVHLLVRFVEFLNYCDEKPFWLKLFHEYLKTGERKYCPPKFRDLCKKYRLDSF
jgi:DtxR family Mn-dependent transcriptional regulator